MLDTNNPLLSWIDFNLIPDETCAYAVDKFVRENTQITTFDAIVLDKDHARMWNIDVSSYLSYTDIGKTILEREHPFWVDRNGTAHVTPQLDERIAMKTTEKDDDDDDKNDDCATNVQPIDTLSRSTYIRDKFHVLLDDHLEPVMKKNPSIRLLMIDQYEHFVKYRQDRVKFPNLVYAFSCAPTVGRLSVTDESLFYDSLNEQQYEIVKSQIRSSSANDTKNLSRECHFSWRTYVPNINYVAKRYDTIRTTIVQLFDDSSTRPFWRNLLYNCIQNEQQQQQQQSSSSTSPSFALIIRVCFQKPKNIDIPDEQLAMLRRFKRFMAYLTRTYRFIYRKKLQRAPCIVWTTKHESSRETVLSLYNAMLKEYIIGAREKLINFDRYVKPPVSRPIRSSCTIAIEPKRTDDYTDSSNNTLGIFYETLIDYDDFFKTSTYRVGNNVTYTQRSHCGAPVQKLYQYEY